MRCTAFQPAWGSCRRWRRRSHPRHRLGLPQVVRWDGKWVVETERSQWLSAYHRQPQAGRREAAAGAAVCSLRSSGESSAASRAAIGSTWSSLLGKWVNRRKAYYALARGSGERRGGCGAHGAQPAASGERRRRAAPIQVNPKLAALPINLAPILAHVTAGRAHLSALAEARSVRMARRPAAQQAPLPAIIHTNCVRWED